MTEELDELQDENKAPDPIEPDNGMANLAIQAALRPDNNVSALTPILGSLKGAVLRQGIEQKNEQAQLIKERQAKVQEFERQIFGQATNVLRSTEIADEDKKAEHLFELGMKLEQTDPKKAKTLFDMATKLRESKVKKAEMEQVKIKYMSDTMDNKELNGLLEPYGVAPFGEGRTDKTDAFNLLAKYMALEESKLSVKSTEYKMINDKLDAQRKMVSDFKKLDPAKLDDADRKDIITRLVNEGMDFDTAATVAYRPQKVSTFQGWFGPGWTQGARIFGKRDETLIENAKRVLGGDYENVLQTANNGENTALRALMKGVVMKDYTKFKRFISPEDQAKVEAAMKNEKTEAPGLLNASTVKKPGRDVLVKRLMEEANKTEQEANAIADAKGY